MRGVIRRCGRCELGREGLLASADGCQHARAGAGNERAQAAAGRRPRSGRGFPAPRRRAAHRSRTRWSSRSVGFAASSRRASFRFCLALALRTWGGRSAARVVRGCSAAAAHARRSGPTLLGAPQQRAGVNLTPPPAAPPPPPPAAARRRGPPSTAAAPSPRRPRAHLLLVRLCRAQRRDERLVCEPGDVLDVVVGLVGALGLLLGLAGVDALEDAEAPLEGGWGWGLRG